MLFWVGPLIGAWIGRNKVWENSPELRSIRENQHLEYLKATQEWKSNVDNQRAAQISSLENKISDMENKVIPSIISDIQNSKVDIISSHEVFESFSEDDVERFKGYANRHYNQYLERKQAQERAAAQQRAYEEAMRREEEAEARAREDFMNDVKSAAFKGSLAGGAVGGFAGGFFGSKKANDKASNSSSHRDYAYKTSFDRELEEKRRNEFVYGGSKYSSPSQRAAAWDSIHKK